MTEAFPKPVCYAAGSSGHVLGGACGEIGRPAVKVCAVGVQRISAGDEQ